jgi:fibro-slime domain-containing protein
MIGTYFFIPNRHPDTGHPPTKYCIVPGLVQSELGPHGLPVASAMARSGGSHPIVDVNDVGEILWWSKDSRHRVIVEREGKNDPLPLPSAYRERFFPEGHHGNYYGFRAVHWRHEFTLGRSQRIRIKLTSDDDAFLFIDGKLEVDNGGSHGLSGPKKKFYGPFNPGTHKLDLFFADRFQSESGIEFEFEPQ